MAIAFLGGGCNSSLPDVQSSDSGLIDMPPPDAGMDAPSPPDATVVDMASFDAGPSDASFDGPAFLEDGGTLLRLLTFPTTTWPSGIRSDEVATDGVEIVPSPWDASHNVLKFLIRAGEQFGGDGGMPRSEMNFTLPAEVARFEWNRLYRITGAFYFPSDTMYPNNGRYGVGQLIAGWQIHGDDAQSPVLSVHCTSGVLELDYRPTDGNTVFLTESVGPMPTGELVHWEIMYRPAIDETGYVRVRINGVTELEHVGPSNRVGDETGGYLKYGLYDYWHTLEYSSLSSLTLYADDIAYYAY